MKTKKFIPRLVVLELTRRCTLSCIHCRASAIKDGGNHELSSNEWLKILDDISSFSSSIIILSGGEALLREDCFKIIQHCRHLGLTVVLATCGVVLTEEKVAQLKETGIKRVSVSIDGKDALTHDFLRQTKGAFELAIKAIALLKKYGIEFQINTTVTKHNFRQLEEILRLAIHLGAASFHPFFLVPVGRAENLQDALVSADESEWALAKLSELSLKSSISCRPTCAPHYFRILSKHNIQKTELGLDSLTSGCLGGKSFAFISSSGKVQACGFLEIECGDIRKDAFSKIWYSSVVFDRLRNFSKYKGKCGECEYLEVCGGCRARAYQATGDYLSEEPECIYQPIRLRSGLIVSDRLITHG